MRTVRIDEVKGTRFAAPYAPTIKHLVAPSTTGLTCLWPAPGERHRLISAATESLRVRFAVVPPFTAEDFAAAHLLAEARPDA